MTEIIADRVQETTTTTGTGALTLGGASDPSFVTFGSVMSVNDTCRYCLLDPVTNAWEVGNGTYSAGNTLARTTVEASSNSGGLVNLAGSAGTYVFLDLSASLIRSFRPLPRVVTSSANTTLLLTDGLVAFNRTSSPAATQVTLPASPYASKRLRIKDMSANSATYPITVVPAAGTIDGAANYALSRNGACVDLEFNGSEWSVISFTLLNGATTPFGTPQVISASGAQTIDATKSLVILSNTSLVINATLPNGTVDGQEIQVVVLPGAAAHTLAGTFFEKSDTYTGLSSPNGGLSFHFKWSQSRTSWYPFAYDAGYKITDDANANALTGAEVLSGVQTQGGSSVNVKITPPQVAAFVLENLPSWANAARPSLGASQFALGWNTSSSRAEIGSTSGWHGVARSDGEIFTGRVAVTPGVLTDGNTITTDATAGNFFTLTLSASGHTLSNPSNLVAGQEVTWIITQGGAGSNTLSYGTLFTWRGGSAPTLSTAVGAVDIISGIYDGSKLRCNAGTGYA